jgi:hypothetical protein
MTQTFIFTLKHDKGRTRLQVTASSMSAAFDKVMKAEGCPRSAIKRVVSAEQPKRVLYAS